MIRQQLKKLRVEQGLKQIDLAKLAGTSQAHISWIETGRVNPDTPLLHKIANALGYEYKESLVKKRF